MKKLWVFLLFAFLLLVKVPLVRATGYEGQAPNLNWQCLESKKTGSHTAVLTAKKTNQFPPPGTDVYIVECIATDAGDKCTTGVANTDQFLFRNTNDLTYLKSQYKYELQNVSPAMPVKSTTDGKIPTVSWTSEVHPTTGHRFFGVSIIPELMANQQYSPGLKLTTFYFTNASEECGSLRWDPYGRVFDSKSLEPINNVVVTLYEKTGDILKVVALPGVINPQYTLQDGFFNFVVPDGTYVLKPQISSHTFPNTPSFLNPNYTKAYSDIYRGEDIVQAGTIQHRDIPIDPVGAPYQAPVKIMDYSIVLNKVYAKYEISGEVSHPLSTIKAYNGTKYITQVTASKFGRFDITIPSESVNPSDDIRLEAIKTDLTYAGLPPTHQEFLPTLFTKLMPVVQAAIGNSISMQPIPNQLEGYAYDSAGQPVGKATVTIYLVSSKRPFTQVTADSGGYFKIPSQYLPPLPYVIEIRSPNGTTNVMTTSQFAKANEKFINERKVNYGKYNPIPETPTTPGVGTVIPNYLTPEAGSTVSAIVSPTASSGSDWTEEENLTATPKPDSSSKFAAAKNFAVSVLLLLVVIGIIAGIYFIYKKKKTEEAPPEPPINP